MKVENTKPTVVWLLTKKGSPDIKLMPGVNIIEDKIWDLARETLVGIKDRATGKKRQISQVDLHVEAGNIRVIRGEGTESDDLSNHPEAEAIQIAKKTLDLPLLHKLIAKEKRPAVKAALEGQVAEINRPPTPEELAERSGRSGEVKVETDADGDERAVMPKPVTHASHGHGKKKY